MTMTRINNPRMWPYFSMLPCGSHLLMPPPLLLVFSFPLASFLQNTTRSERERERRKAMPQRHDFSGKARKRARICVQFGAKEQWTRAKASQWRNSCLVWNHSIFSSLPSLIHLRFDLSFSSISMKNL